ncbi:phage tail terminator-like protein [Cupriavidus sp. a3]|uniref:phage tail terminator-like protein n=1 Tax=Cupriavidus sp. a3 TaxID=3242158 RepID=UPI003D9C27DC
MSNVAVRKALETRLNAMAPALATAWQNVQFTPAAGVPYQRADLLLGAPENPAYGDYYREVGVLQVSLMYPSGAGPGAAEARAAAIRDWFKRGTTLVADGIEVVVQRTPTIAAGYADGDRWRVPVSIPFFASA